jgi:hypothetical protein
MKAIETRYKGYRFRSRLEARWAVVLDSLGVRWQYEPEGFMTSAGPYLPDFRVDPASVTFNEKGYLRRSRAWGDVYLEVKGAPLRMDEAERLRAFACDVDAVPRWVFALGDIPEPRQMYGYLFITGWGMGGAAECLLAGNGLTDVAVYNRADEWGQTRLEFMSQSFNTGRVTDCYEAKYCDTRSPLNSALGAGRGARFEHGETPVMPAMAPARPEPTVPRMTEPRAVSALDIYRKATRDFPPVGEISGMRCISCRKQLRWGQVTCLCGDKVNMPPSDRRLPRAHIR